MAREPITLVEIDVGSCGRVFGTAPCTAVLAGSVVRKCYNTFATCAAPLAFLPVVQTLTFSGPQSNVPRGGAVIFPALISVSVTTATVNIAGSDEGSGPLGREAEVDLEFQDFPYNDSLTDPYQAQRISGAAQTDEPGYQPILRGMFFGKLRARWPYYAGRPARLKQGYLINGQLTNMVTRNFVISEMSPSDPQNRVKVSFKDPMSILANDRAVYPAISQGAVLTAITAGGLAITLTPAGVGASYALAGEVVIGSEIVAFTRVGDVLTLSARGVAGTIAAAHAAGDAVQTVGVFAGVRLDDAVARLCLAAPGFLPAWIPTATWANEVTRWAPEVLLRTRVTSPTGIALLLGELMVLGISTWWDDFGQIMGLKCNRPPDADTVYDLTEAANLIEISAEDRDAARLTDIIFATVQTDPTKGVSGFDNFRRAGWTFDAKAKDARAYGDSRIRKIFSRWFNDGSDSDVLVLSSRLLKRFSATPVRVKVTLDAKETAIRLTDVLRVTARIFADTTGKPVPTLLQVTGRSDPKPGHSIELTAQAYQFAGRYGYATPDASPDYAGASAAQKLAGEFAVDDVTLIFPDNTPAYEAI